MRRTAFLFLALTTIGGALRAALPSATEDAFGVCDSLSFESEKETCQRAVRGKFFDARAVDICATANFASEKTTCLAAIAGREFTSAREVSICAKKAFASERLKCLQEGGAVDRTLVAGAATPAPSGAPTAPGGTIDTREIRESITEAIGQIENNRPFNASQVLQALLKKIPK